MTIISEVNRNQTSIKKFLDWDEYKNIFYNNIYLENQKLVIKMPLIPTEVQDEDIKIKKFNLAKYTFLINY